MSNAVIVFADNSSAISFSNKKGDMFAMSPEGALFKGGAAMAALKDAVMLAAGSKAANGKYRAAADIIATAFPAHTKGFEKFVGTPWANKSAFVSYLNSIAMLSAPVKGFSKKQLAVQDFILALHASIPGLVAESEKLGDVVMTA